MTDYKVFGVISGNSKINERERDGKNRGDGRKKISEEIYLSREEYPEVVKEIRRIPIHSAYRDRKGFHYFLKDGGQFTTNPEQRVVIASNIDEAILKKIIK